MPRLPYLDLVSVDLALPHSTDGLWSLIRQLDKAGPWTATDVCRQTNINPGTPRRLIRRLKAGGYLKEVGSVLRGKKNPQPAPLYRLVKRPIEAPRLNDRGEQLPELGIETLWRSMKMAKTFTVNELAELAAGDGRPVHRNTAQSYLNRLALVGIVGRMPPSGRETRYRLVRNLGLHAPKVLGVRIVFDPNARAVVGTAVAREVQP